MKYALLIYSDTNTLHAAPEDAVREMYMAFGTFNDELAAAGKTGPAGELAAPETAKSVRVRDGERLVTDGPFAEMREQLGGFYVIDAADMEEALDWAAKIPSAPFGTIEVRPMAPDMRPQAG